MSVIKESIVIDAPKSKVFDFVVNPQNWTRYVTGLVEVNNLSPGSPKKGSTCTWKYRMMGMNFSGKGTVTEYEKDKDFGWLMEGMIPIKEKFGFSDKGDGKMEFTFQIEYEVPGAILGEVADKLLIEKLNTLEVKNVLQKIKTICEGK